MQMSNSTSLYPTGPETALRVAERAAEALLGLLPTHHPPAAGQAGKNARHPQEVPARQGAAVRKRAPENVHLGSKNNSPPQPNAGPGGQKVHQLAAKVQLEEMMPKLTQSFDPGACGTPPSCSQFEPSNSKSLHKFFQVFTEKLFARHYTHLCYAITRDQQQ